MRIHRFEMRAKLSQEQAMADVADVLSILAAAGLSACEIRASKRTVDAVYGTSDEAWPFVKVDNSMDDMEIVLVGEQKANEGAGPTLFDDLDDDLEDDDLGSLGTSQDVFPDLQLP
jgi:hypothetical protein